MARQLLAALVISAQAAGTADGSGATLADPIAEWSLAASRAAAAAGMAPLRTPVTLAILHLAMYDATNAIDGDRQPYVAAPPVVRPASARAAAVEAGYRILLAEFPGQQALLDSVYQALRSGAADDEAAAHGAAVGAAAAEKLLAVRASDGRNAFVPYVPASGAGEWVPTPPAFLPATTAFLARVKPFTLESVDQFRPAGPPAFRSRRWVEDYAEVKALGSRLSTQRSAEQTATAMFWEPLAGTVWPASIRRLAQEQALDIVSAARFQAAAFAAFADGLIACWDAKFHFRFWRPITAIQADDADGQPATEADPGWQPLAVTPNFPEYPSGHACATAAVAHTIEDFFARDVAIPARHFNTGEERVYRRAKDVVDEVIDARMLLGVHFRFANEDGAEIGRRIARQIRSRLFKQRPSSHY